VVVHHRALLRVIKDFERAARFMRATVRNASMQGVGTKMGTLGQSKRWSICRCKTLAMIVSYLARCGILRRRGSCHISIRLAGYTPQLAGP
jgi:hypothetical protein